MKTKSEVKVENKSIVIPGEILAHGMDFVPSEGTFRENENIIASKIGIFSIDGRVIRIIPLNGRYIPRCGDTIIAEVSSVGPSNWLLDINYAYHAGLSMSEGSSDYIEKGADLSKYYAIGDFVVAKVTRISGGKVIDLSMKGPGLRKLHGGNIIYISSAKVPRVIGKQGSMVSLIKEKTKCRISVGQNGVVWINGENPKDEIIAKKAIELIDKNAHVQGLTELINNFLEKEYKK